MTKQIMNLNRSRKKVKSHNKIKVQYLDSTGEELMQTFQLFKVKTIRIFPILLMLAFLVMACNTSEASPGHPPLKVTWNLWPGNYPIVLAKELNLFEKHGVEVESILSHSYDTMAPDFIERKTDVVLFTLVDALLIDAREPDSARVTVVIDESNGADVVIAAPDIKTVADLRGQRLGASSGSFGELLVRQMLATNNLTFDELTMVDIGPEAVPEAIPTSIEAGFTFDIYASPNPDDHHVIFSSADAPGLIVDVMIFRREVIEDRPEDVRAFIDAWFEAVDYWQANPDEGTNIIARALDLPAEEISLDGLRLFNRADNLQAFNPGSDTRSLFISGQVNADFLISTGGLTTAPNLGRLLMPSFLEKR
ncbi:MAG TPA: ABC transporter substrate-binding protein [Anaerolineae bacterium]